MKNHAAVIANRSNKEDKMATANGISIWYETFGGKNHPALLLIMGRCCQGIMWPAEFCERLAKEKFYVIRYDHRDTGHSTCFDFQTDPYNIFDLAKDALGILDCLGIEKPIYAVYQWADRLPNYWQFIIRSGF